MGCQPAPAMTEASALVRGQRGSGGAGDLLGYLDRVTVRVGAVEGDARLGGVLPRRAHEWKNTITTRGISNVFTQPSLPHAELGASESRNKMLKFAPASIDRRLRRGTCRRTPSMSSMTCADSAARTCSSDAHTCGSFQGALMEALKRFHL